MKSSISACVLTHNSEKTLERCLETIKFCNEVIVIDDGSEDKSLLIAQKYNTKIFKRSLNSDYAAQRNFALSKANNDWVLFIDSDEYLSNDLQREISKLNLDNNVHGYYMRRENFMWGKRLKYGEWGDIKLLRLANRRYGHFGRKVHEIWQISGRTGVLESSLIHNQGKTMTAYISDINTYANLHANELYKERKKSSFIKIICMPAFKLADNLFFKKGILDGTQGFILAVIMSFHSFLGWSQLYIKQNK